MYLMAILLLELVPTILYRLAISALAPTLLYFILLHPTVCITAHPPYLYSVTISSHSVKRTFNGQPGEQATTDVYCEGFDMKSPYIQNDPIYHANNAIVNDKSVILVRNHRVGLQKLPQPLECIDRMSGSEGRVKQSLSAIRSPIDETRFGKRFNGTAYYVGRFANNNPYHLLMEGTFPVFVMMLAHGRLSGGGLSPGTNRESRESDDCCLYYDDLPPFRPANQAFDELDKKLQVCSRCSLTNGYIWANHVVVHFPLEVRPNHVNYKNWPDANSQYTLDDPVKYLIRQFRHYLFHRLRLPFPETHVLGTYSEPKIVYVKRVTGRELANIADIELRCKERNCGINFVTAESLGSGIEQVEFFSHVDMLIGVEGAAFVHALHMPMGSILIQLHPPREVTQVLISPKTGQQIRFPRPYRYFAPISMYLEHILVNICMPGNTVDVDLFFQTVSKYTRQRGQVIDVYQFS